MLTITFKTRELISISTNTDYEQALKVSEITRNLTDNTVIVLGNEGILSPLLSNLNIKDKKWNVTMGYKLTQLPIVRFFLHILIYILACKTIILKPSLCLK